eukprot:GEMP01061787.1.p1 GENE.GEMP01061787.1~~GEMP01061787.1.p1  ORF type:complete len:126 (+),score=27.41 GEMP01061787.1:136-513(+)
MDIVFRDEDEEVVRTWFPEHTPDARQADLLDQVHKIAAKTVASEKRGIGAAEVVAEETTAAKGALAKRLRKAERAREEEESQATKNVTTTCESSGMRGQGINRTGWIDPLDALSASLPNKKKRRR